MAALINPHGDIAGPAHAPWWAWVGVQIFFVISGVVISFSAEKASASSFFVGRVTRLWPMIVAAIVLIVPLNLLFWHKSIGTELDAVAHSLLLLPIGPWVTGQMWTLPIEAIFYGTVWLMLAVGLQKHLLVFARLLGIYSAVFWIIITGFGIAPFGQSAMILAWHGIYFAIGMLIMRLSWARLTVIDGLTLLLCVVGAWCEIHTTAARELPGVAIDAAVPFGVWLGTTVFIFAATLYREQVAAVVVRWRLVALLRNLGLLTYPLYMLHAQVGALVVRAGLGLTGSVWAAATLGYAAAVLLALVALKTVDRPLTALFRTLSQALVARVPRWPISAPESHGADEELSRDNG